MVSAQDVLVFQDAEIPKKEAKGLPSFLLETPTPNRLPTLRKARCNELQSNDIQAEYEKDGQEHLNCLLERRQFNLLWPNVGIARIVPPQQALDLKRAESW